MEEANDPTPNPPRSEAGNAAAASHHAAPALDQQHAQPQPHPSASSSSSSSTRLPHQHPHPHPHHQQQQHHQQHQHQQEQTTTSHYPAHTPLPPISSSPHLASSSLSSPSSSAQSHHLHHQQQQQQEKLPPISSLSSSSPTRPPPFPSNSSPFQPSHPTGSEQRILHGHDHPNISSSRSTTATTSNSRSRLKEIDDYDDNNSNVRRYPQADEGKMRANREEGEEFDEDEQDEDEDDDEEEDDLSSLSSSLSMDERDEDDEAEEDSRIMSTTNKRAANNNPGRLGPSSTSTARKRTANVGSHSDLDSQSDSAVDSQPHSESESDPDPESRPLAEGSRVSATVTTARTSSPPALTNTAGDTSSSSRRMSTHIGRRQSRHMGNSALSATASSSVGMDRSMGHGQGQGYGHGQGQDDAGSMSMSASSMVVRPMPRRELLPDGHATLHDDSVATASESEGSMAADGNDHARPWPSSSSSAQERPRFSSSSASRPQGAEHRLVEIKTSSLSKQAPPHQHHHHHPHHQTTSSSAPPPTSTVMTRSSRVKDSITKDSAPRKWICKQVPVKTLGGEMMMPIWFSEEDMLLNEPVAPIELDTDNMNLDLAGGLTTSGQHHHHHHHHHLMVDDAQQTNTARHKRKLKLKDMALRESRDPQDFVDLPEPMDNKRRHHDAPAKDAKGKGVAREYQSGEKRIKIQKESNSAALRRVKLEKTKKIRKIIRERSESYGSTRDSTPVPTTPPVEGTPEEGSPPRQRRPPESNMSSPSGGPRPRPFICEIEDCGKRFVDALQLERHIERHGPKELECDLDMCGKLFSSIMLLRRHQSMVHKRRSEKWESPPGTTRQRSGRSRRKEPRIVASGDIMDPAELEELPRDPMDVDEDEDPEDDDENGAEDDEDGELSRAARRLNEAKGRDARQIKIGRPPKESKLPREPKIKEPKQPKERKTPKVYMPKKLAPKGEDGDGQDDDTIHGGSEAGDASSNAAPSPAGPTQPRPRPFHCTHDDCKKVFIDATQLERHLERHGPKELECGIDGCRKRFSAQMLLRRHQSMVHKRRSPAVNVSATTGSRQVRPPAGSTPSSRLAAPPLDASALASSSPEGSSGYAPSSGHGHGYGSSSGYQPRHGSQPHHQSPPPPHHHHARQQHAHHAHYPPSSQT